jgi:hypothetical protein
MGVRHILAAAASMLSAILFAASCGGDRPSTPPSPLASTASPAPKPTFGALPTPTGIAEIDEVVRATLAGDSGALIRMLAYERLACVIPQQEGSPPGCRNGETAGTVVDALLVGGCGGNYLRTDEAERVISGTVTTAGRALYAVFRPGFDRAEYRVVFVYKSTDRLGFRFDVTGGHIVSLFMTCGPVETATTGVRDFIVSPRDPAQP